MVNNPLIKLCLHQNNIFSRTYKIWKKYHAFDDFVKVSMGLKKGHFQHSPREIFSSSQKKSLLGLDDWCTQPRLAGARRSTLERALDGWVEDISVGEIPALHEVNIPHFVN